jgi:hypothetical protein
MQRSIRLALAVYLVLVFSTLPLLPPVANALRKALGEGPFSMVLFAGLAAAGLAPVLRLPGIPPPLRMKPAGQYLLLLAGGAIMGLSLASSPVGRIHIAEYALLGFLVVRALPSHLVGPPLMALAVATAALTGLVDETVQHFLPNRVFDWYDVALNGGSALLGVLFSSWWDLTEKINPDHS